MRHVTVSGVEEDGDGFVFAKCACGFISEPVPDLEILLDVMMEHAEEAGMSE